MKETRNVSELIELHLELKAKAGDMPGRSDVQEPEEPEAEGTLPPRSTLFPSNRKKLTQIFYNTLFFLFVLLVISLVVWGMRLD